MSGFLVPRNAVFAQLSADIIGANMSAGYAIAWDAEGYDDGGWHDNVTNNQRLTVPAGVNRIRLACGLRINNAGTATFPTMLFLKNGTGAFKGCGEIALGTNILVANQLVGVIATGPLAVVGGTDYFQVYIQCGVDASVDIDSVGSYFSAEAC